MEKLFNINNKNILVTGASSGIGRACSILLSHLGANIFLVGRSKSRLAETYEMLLGDKHQIFEFDLLEVDKIKFFVKDNFSAIKFHSIVNCAGVSPTSPYLFSTPKKLQSTLLLNVMAPYELTRTVIKHASNSEMSIVFIASVMGMVGEKAKSMYSLSKGALIALTKSLAIELADKNIRVNAISPAVVDTPLIKNSEYYKSKEGMSKILEKHPLGIGLDKDIALSVLFLVSDQSRWVTGQNMVVDGGYTSK